MSIFQRIVLLIKVLVILSLGAASAAWAGCPEEDQKGAGFSTGAEGSGFHAVYADDPEEDEETDEEEEGDSQT